MATTLTQLILRARERADMVGSSFVSDSEITTRINLGLAELYDLVVGAYEDYFTTSTTLTITSGNSVALPANFYKLRGLDYSLNGSWTNCLQYNFTDRNVSGVRDFWRLLPDSGRRYRLIGDNLVMQSVDTAPGTYRLWYAPAYTPLVAGADTIPESLSKFGWDEYIVLYAAEFMLSKEESSITDVRNERAAIASRIEKMAADRQVEQAETITDVTGQRGRFYYDY